MPPVVAGEQLAGSEKLPAVVVVAAVVEKLLLVLWVLLLLLVPGKAELVQAGCPGY